MFTVILRNYILKSRCDTETQFLSFESIHISKLILSVALVLVGIEEVQSFGSFERNILCS